MSDSVAGVPLYMCHVAFLEQTGIWGQEVAIFEICIMSLAVGNRERSTGRNNGIYHLSELIITEVTVRSEAQKCPQASKLLPALCFAVGLCWFHLKVVFSYNCKMAKVLAEAH